MRKLDCPDPEIQTRYIIKFTIVSNEFRCLLFLVFTLLCLLAFVFVFFLNATFWSEPSYLVLKSSDSVRA